MPFPERPADGERPEASAGLTTVQAPRRTTCWCGETDGTPIGPDYRRCARCGTAVAAHLPPASHFEVRDDERDFYGKAYWLDYQKERGFPDVVERARTDPSERCLFWLHRLLDVVRPPGRALELGCGHGAFVSLLGELGFDAVGVDLSPWIVEFARQTFGVSVRQGTLETLDLEPGFACIAAFDVLEHLADPLDLLRRCARLLAPDGVLLLQTPCYRSEGPDWPMFQRDEHIYLFTEAALRELLGRAGFNDVDVRASLFPYDMWVTATPGTLRRQAPPGGRLPTAFRALLALDEQAHRLRHELAEAEADRTERLRQVGDLTEIVRKAEADRLTQVDGLTAQVAELTEIARKAEADRLTQVEALTAQAAELTGIAQTAEADRLTQVEALAVQVAELTGIARKADSDRQRQSEELTRLLQESEADRAARLDVIRGAETQLQTLNTEIQDLQHQARELRAALEAAERTTADQAAQVDALREKARQLEVDRVVRVEALTRRVEDLAELVRTSEAERIAQVEELAAQIEALLIARKRELERIERADSLTTQVEELARLLQESEADRAARLEVIRGAEVQVVTLHARIRELQDRLTHIERTAVWRVYRTLARGK